MPTPPLSDELCRQAAEAFTAAGREYAAGAKTLGVPVATFRNRVLRAAERGMVGYAPVMPGFAVKSTASKVGDVWVKQTRAPGEVFALPEGHSPKGISALLDPEGRVINQWVKTDRDAGAALAALKAAAEGFKDDLPRAKPVKAPKPLTDDLLNMFVVTDVHMGMLAWHEETGADYDIAIAERLLLNWFEAAIELAPHAHTAVLAQLGDPTPPRRPRERHAGAPERARRRQSPAEGDPGRHSLRSAYHCDAAR
jgi:hypothetical protein